MHLLDTLFVGPGLLFFLAFFFGSRRFCSYLCIGHCLSRTGTLTITATMARTTNMLYPSLCLSLSLSVSLFLMGTLFECILYAAALIRLKLRHTVGPPCLCTAPFWLSVKKKMPAFSIYHIPYMHIACISSDWRLGKNNNQLEYHLFSCMINLMYSNCFCCS